MKRIGPIAALLISIAPACGRPGATQATPSTQAPSREAAPVVDAGASDAGPPSDREIDADLATLVGGMLSPDHLAPGAHRALLARYQAEPVRYLDRLAHVYLRQETHTTHHANLYIAHFLWRLHPLAPKDVERIASRFLGAWTLVLGRVDLEPGQRERLEDQAKLARVLAGGVDRPSDDTWPLTDVSSVCVVPVPGGQGLVVTQDCTCGQPLACNATMETGRVLVTARLNQGAPAVCDDCYPGWTTCSVKDSAAGLSLEIVVNGTTRGSFQVNEEGRLPYDSCLRAR